MPAKRTWTKREYAAIGLADLAGAALPVEMVERYCEHRRIAVTGLQQSSFLEVMAGHPMYRRVSPAFRKECEKYADEFLTRCREAGIIPTPH